MPTPYQRSAEARERKLAAIQRRVQDGSLTIRTMTDAERARYPKPEVPTVKRGRR